MWYSWSRGIFLIAQLVQEDEDGGIPPLVWIILLAILVALIIWWWLRSPRQSETHPHTHEASPRTVQPTTHSSTSHAPARTVSHATVPPPPPPPPPPVVEPVMEAVKAAPPPVIEPMMETAAPEPPPPPPPAKPDDLTIVEGIGPKINAILQSVGITTFHQLAETPVSRLQEIMLSANLRIADPTTWPEQAALAAAGKMDELQVLQDNLKGGRKA